VRAHGTKHQGELPLDPHHRELWTSLPDTVRQVIRDLMRALLVAEFRRRLEVLRSEQR
jgi:hypothetical protein